jgi:hypothetical protein
MDDDIGFWLAKQILEKKYTMDVRPIIQQTMDNVQKKPLVMITIG